MRKLMTQPKPHLIKSTHPLNLIIQATITLFAIATGFILGNLTFIKPDVTTPTYIYPTIYSIGLIFLISLIRVRWPINQRFANLASFTTASLILSFTISYYTTYAIQHLLMHSNIQSAHKEVLDAPLSTQKQEEQHYVGNLTTIRLTPQNNSRQCLWTMNQWPYVTWACNSECMKCRNRAPTQEPPAFGWLKEL